MNSNFKTELAEFARDLRAVCDSIPHNCSYCPLVDADDGCCKGGLLNSHFDPEAAIAAVDAYRKRKKPCAEVIDKAVDIYTYPQPMSAVEYERVCRLFGYWCASHRLCSECDFFVDCPHSYKEGYGCAMPTPEERVVAIQKWAQEHPDKVSEGGKEE